MGRVTRLFRRLVIHGVTTSRRTSKFKSSSSTVWRLKELTTESKIHCSADCSCLSHGGSVQTIIQEKLDSLNNPPTTGASSTTVPSAAQNAQTEDDASSADAEPVHLFYRQRDVSANKSQMLVLKRDIGGEPAPVAYAHTKERAAHPPPEGVYVIADVCSDLLASGRTTSASSPM